ncbi:hypothetical protein ACWDYK_07145 [Streptomyces anthocyanicus]|uniref:hypothetical protein n=1 Tax=Streptomyces anthocyanicus TaxID=68174 RepID=UPI002F90D201|nr:hypothetical protein OHA15_40160 [Streptomyces anthocyanicus]
MRGTSEEQSRETARAVRLLLEEAVPSPAAPADRMARIGRRVRRRRRQRRAAAGAVVSVAAVVAAVTVVPGQVPGTGTPARPAASPSPTTTVRLLDPSRPVWTEVPDGWHGLSVRDANGDFVGFVSSQPLHAPQPEGCYRVPAAALGECRPLDQLAAGGALVIFRYGYGHHVTDGAQRSEPVTVRPLKTCTGTGADGERVHWEVVDSARDVPFEVEVSVCLREPTKTARAIVERIVDTAFPRAAD